MAALTRTLRRFRRQWIDPVVHLGRLRSAPRLYARYLGEYRRYRRLPGAETIAFEDLRPFLFDRVRTNPFDGHYLYQDIWAFRRISESRPGIHVDVGSRAIFTAMVSTVTQTAYVDIRPLLVRLPSLTSISGSLLALPFRTGSLESLSCLHVAEHVGLGRYGDPLDPEGTQKAAAELGRVLAPGGSLYFSLPIGFPRVCFNAHRVHSVQQVLELFQGLDLVELSAVTDDRRFLADASAELLDGASYACGLFRFRLPPASDAPSARAGSDSGS